MPQRDCTRRSRAEIISPRDTYALLCLLGGMNIDGYQVFVDEQSSDARGTHPKMEFDRDVDDQKKKGEGDSSCMLSHYVRLPERSRSPAEGESTGQVGVF